MFRGGKFLRALNSLKVRLMLKFITKFRKDEEGAALVEYGVLLALITAVVIGLIQALGTEISTVFAAVTGILTGG